MKEWKKNNWLICSTSRKLAMLRRRKKRWPPSARPPPRTPICFPSYSTPPALAARWEKSSTPWRMSSAATTAPPSGDPPNIACGLARTYTCFETSDFFFELIDPFLERSQGKLSNVFAGGGAFPGFVVDFLQLFELSPLLL